MKYDWAPIAPQARGGIVPLSATEPDKVAKTLEPALGQDVAAMVRDQLAAALKNLGLDTVDRRHLVIPGANGGAGGHLTSQERQRYTAADLTMRRSYPEGSDAWMRKMDLMAGYFRAMLFGTPMSQTCGDMDEAMVRVLSHTDAAGGFLIPPGFVPELLRDVPKLSQLFGYVRRMSVGVDSGNMPKVGTNATVYWGTENVTFDEGDPAFLEVTYAVNRMNALVKLSREIASDTNPDIVATVTSLFQEAIAEERDKVIAIGSGSGKPLGLYSSTAISDVSAVTTLTYPNLVKIKESVDQRYHGRPGFRWVFNQNVKAAIMNILDGQNQPIFNPSKGNLPSTILDVPYSIEASLPNSCVIIGDLSYYIWFDRQSLAVERTIEGGDAFAKHQMWIKFYERADGKPVVPNKVPFARVRALTGVTALT